MDKDISIKTPHPKVSVIIPVYNGEKYISQTIESFLWQTYKNFELIIINDGSTDNTKSILECYKKKDKRIIVQHQVNKGVGAASRKACDIASGKYIARSDGDDLSYPQRIEKQVNFLELHPEVGILGAQMEVIDENDKIIFLYKVPTSHNMIVWMLMFGRSFGHSSVMLRKDVLNKVGGYKPIEICEDYDLFSRMAGHTQFRNLPESLIRYRHHSSGASNIRKMEFRNQFLSLRTLFAREKLRVEVSRDALINIDKSNIRDCVLTNEQQKEAINVILELYHAMITSSLIHTSETKNIYNDMLNRIITVGRCSQTPPKELARAYWKSIIPKTFWPVIRAILHLKQKVIN